MSMHSLYVYVCVYMYIDAYGNPLMDPTNGPSPRPTPPPTQTVAAENALIPEPPSQGGFRVEGHRYLELRQYGLRSCFRALGLRD